MDFESTDQTGHANILTEDQIYGDSIISVYSCDCVLGSHSFEAVSLHNLPISSCHRKKLSTDLNQGSAEFYHVVE